MKGLVMEFKTLDFYPKEKGFEYFTMFICEMMKGKKTPEYMIRGNGIKAGFLLGRIIYYAPWRKFVLEPSKDTVWNTGCLYDIISFLVDLNEAHKQELENRKLKT